MSEYTFHNLTRKHLSEIDTLEFESGITSYIIIQDADSPSDNEHLISVEDEIIGGIEGAAKFLNENCDSRSISSADIYTFLLFNNSSKSFAGCDIMDFLPSAL